MSVPLRFLLHRFAQSQVFQIQARLSAIPAQDTNLKCRMVVLLATRPGQSKVIITLA